MEAQRVDEIDGIWPFLQSIDWSEPWLIGLVGYHLACSLVTYLTKSSGNMQAIHGAFMLLFVYFSENINELGAKHWRLFSKQQYFDSHGLFISIVFSLPLLINCLIIIVFWLYTSGNLMIKVKQAELLRQTKEADGNRTNRGKGKDKKERGNQMKGEEEKMDEDKKKD